MDVKTRPGRLRPRGPPTPSLAGPHDPRSAPAGAPVARLARYRGPDAGPLARHVGLFEAEPLPASQVPAFIFTDCAGIRVQ